MEVYVIPKPGGVTKLLAVLDYQQLVRYELRQGFRVLSGQHQHVGTEYLNPCGYIRDLAFLAAVGMVGGFREDDYTGGDG